ERLSSQLPPPLLAPCTAENITVIYGMEGGTISINCTYNPWQQRWREKSWCKQVDEIKCQHVVSARRFWLQFLKNRNGTTSISDNVHEGVLTVTMKRLKKQDAGLYRCRTEYLGETKTLHKVQVEVLTVKVEPSPSHLSLTEVSVLSYSITPEADSTILCIVTAFLVTKFLAAVLMFTIASRRKNKDTDTEEKNQSLHEQQLLPLPGSLVEHARDGVSPSWENTA
ncbi:TREM2 protein, partial [Nothoprocta pentlandii]|nr:TREM2 protein [Nothoprocta pentlandii]